MASISSLTQTSFVFKTKYAGSIGDVALRFHPTLDMIRKTSRAPGHSGEFVGSSFNYAIRFGNSQGISGTVAGAQAGASASRGAQFAAKRFKKFGDIVIDGESLNAAQDDGAFLDLVTMETDGIIEEHINRLGFDLFRTSNGIRGKRASISTNTVTFATPDDARNFAIDMVVGASPNADGSSPRTGTTTVTAVSLAAGTITLASAAAITAFADNDFLFASGEVGTCMEGMELCTPLVAPVGGDSFRGFDRSIYPELLAGARLPSALSLGLTIEEAAGQSAIEVGRVGGRCTDLALNPTNFWAIARRGNAKVEMANAGGELTYGFESVKIVTPAGTLTAWSDPDCPIDRGRGYNRDKHYIRTLKDFVHIIMDDGVGALRSAAADAIESRTRSMGNYIQTETRDHFVFQI